MNAPAPFGELTGDVAVMSVADLLQYLAQNGRTGILTIRQGDHEKKIHISPRGMRLLATTTRRKSSLGEILIRTKKIDRSQLDRLLAEQQRTGRKLGEIVSRLGVLSRQDIEVALKSQVEEEIYDIFTWLEARFTFIDGVDAPPGDGPLSEPVLAANPTTIMLEAARRADEMHLIMKVVQNEQMIPIRTTKPFDPTDMGEIAETARALYNHTTGRNSIEDVVRRSLYPRFEALRTLYVLVTRGYIRIFDREAATAVGLKASTDRTKAVRDADLHRAEGDRPVVLLLGEMLKYRQFLAAILRDGGFEVVEETFGRAQTLLAGGRKVDAVILDTGINSEEGFGFCAWVSQETGAPVLYLSTDSKKETAARALENGARAYIVKPFTAEIILTHLREALYGSGVEPVSAPKSS